MQNQSKWLSVHCLTTMFHISWVLSVHSFISWTKICSKYLMLTKCVGKCTIGQSEIYFRYIDFGEYHFIAGGMVASVWKLDRLQCFIHTPIIWGMFKQGPEQLLDVPLHAVTPHSRMHHAPTKYFYVVPISAWNLEILHKKWWLNLLPPDVGFQR